MIQHQRTQVRFRMMDEDLRDGLPDLTSVAAFIQKPDGAWTETDNTVQNRGNSHYTVYLEPEELDTVGPLGFFAIAEGAAEYHEVFYVTPLPVVDARLVAIDPALLEKITVTLGMDY